MQMLDWFHYQYAQFQLYQQYQYMDKLYRNMTWPADDIYPVAVDYSEFDIQCCIDYSFLMRLPKYHYEIIDKYPWMYDIAKSYNLSLGFFYVRGIRNDDRISKFYEFNQPHFKKYSDKIKDDLKLHTKSKRANACLLDNLTD